jgi:hypothetical protein
MRERGGEVVGDQPTHACRVPVELVLVTVLQRVRAEEDPQLDLGAEALAARLRHRVFDRAASG